MSLGEKLKELRIAKGYSQAAVADKAKISRRSYIMYEQDNSMPKKKETYENLAKVFDCDVNELLIYKDAAAYGGVATALSLLGSVLGTAALPMSAFVPGVSIAALAVSKASKEASTAMSKVIQVKLEGETLDYNNDMLLQYEKEQRRFQAIATGIIYSKLAMEGVSFTPGNKSILDSLGGKPDEFITVHGGIEYEWWFSFWAKDDELDSNVITDAKDRAAVMISRFTTAKFDENRKITIVVDDESLYEAMMNYKDHNSYRGDMSVMLVNTETVSVVREEAIASL